MSLSPAHLDDDRGYTGITNAFNIPKSTHLFDYYKYLETWDYTQKRCCTYDKTEFASTLYDTSYFWSNCFAEACILVSRFISLSLLLQL